MGRALLLTLLLVCAPVRVAAQANDTDGYWSWGWGVYGLRSQSDPLDNARFDWTFVLLGGPDSTDRATVERANEILRLNPKHRFVLRLWPILGLGDCPENANQATLFHYVFEPEIRRKVLAETRRQIAFFLEHIRNPANVVGATFLEELPFHFTSAPFGPEWKEWQPGRRLPWDLERFAKQIKRDLGKPFNLHDARHRQWWGRQYARTLREIQTVMRKALAGRQVIYYRHSLVNSLDEAPVGSKALEDVEVMPIRYTDVIGPKRADGIFVYPGGPASWERQRRYVQTHRVKMFTQVSLPPSMRGTSLDEMVAFSRWRYAGNLGTFVFTTTGEPRRERAYEASDYATNSELLRRFAWDLKIHPDLVSTSLSPELQVDYDASGSAFDVTAYLWNPREVSWYGGSFDQAALHEVRATLRMPNGFIIEGSSVAVLGTVGPQDGRAVRWRVRRAVDKASVSPTTPIELTVSDASGAATAIVAHESFRRADALRTRTFADAGARWLQPSLPASSWIELQPREQDVDSPLLARVGIERVYYRGVLRPSTRLVLTPHNGARLFAAPLFDLETRSFYSLARTADQIVVDSGSWFYAASGPIVHTGERYRLRVDCNRLDGAQLRVEATFVGTSANKPSRREAVLFDGTEASRDTREVVVPAFDGNTAKVVLQFYRWPERGTLACQTFDFTRSDLPHEGVDVTSQIVGELPRADGPASVWTYSDRSHGRSPNPPSISIRFLAAPALKGSK